MKGLGLRTIFVGIFIVAGTGSSVGQATNAEILSRLALACVTPVTPGDSSIVLAGPDRLPFVRSSIVASWQADGRTVFDGGRDSTGHGPRVRIVVEDAGVRYAGAGKNQLERIVHLDLRTDVIATDGRILHDGPCSESATDRIDKDALDRVENPMWPETRGNPPPAGGFARFVRPVVIGAASAVGVFLFFSLRSRRAGDDG